MVIVEAANWLLTLVEFESYTSHQNLDGRVKSPCGPNGQIVRRMKHSANHSDSYYIF